MTSDLADAFTRECLTAYRSASLRGGTRADCMAAAGLVFLAWALSSQRGVTRDQLIDVLHKIDAAPEPLSTCWPPDRERERSRPGSGTWEWAPDRPPAEDARTRYIVLRPHPGCPPGWCPPRWDGWWLERDQVPDSPAPGRLSTPAGVAQPTGRFEQRTDGALAEIYEIQPPEVTRK